MLSVYVFEGNSFVDDDNAVTIAEWSVEELIRVIGEYVGDCDGVAWKDQPITWAEDDGPKILSETLNIVNSNLAQALKCGAEGGQMYVVRAG